MMIPTIAELEKFILEIGRINQFYLTEAERVELAVCLHAYLQAYQEGLD